MTRQGIRYKEPPRGRAPLSFDPRHGVRCVDCGTVHNVSTYRHPTEGRICLWCIACADMRTAAVHVESEMPFAPVYFDQHRSARCIDCGTVHDLNVYIAVSGPDVIGYRLCDRCAAQNWTFAEEDIMKAGSRVPHTIRRFADYKIPRCVDCGISFALNVYSISTKKSVTVWLCEECSLERYDTIKVISA